MLQKKVFYMASGETIIFQESRARDSQDSVSVEINGSAIKRNGRVTIAVEAIDSYAGGLIEETDVSLQELRGLLLREDPEQYADPSRIKDTTHYPVDEFFFGSPEELEAAKNRVPVVVDDANFVRCPQGILDY
jgi:hypothetical protein